jgi:WD40 repeat protein
MVAETPLCKHVHTLKQPVASVAIAGPWVFAGLLNGIVVVNSVSPVVNADDAERGEFVAHTGVIRSMAAYRGNIIAGTAPTNDATVTLLTCSGDGTAKRWLFSTAGSTWQMTFQGHDGAVECFTVNKQTLLTGGADGTLRQWDLNTGAPGYSARCHAGRVTAVTVPTLPAALAEAADPPPEGSVVTGSDEGLAKLVDLKTKAALAIFSNDTVPVTAVAYCHPELYIAGTDGKVRGFTLLTAQPTRCLSGHRDAVNALLVINSDLYSIADDRVLYLWDLPAWKPKQEFVGHSLSVSAMATDAASGELVTCSFDGTVRVWDAQGVIDRFRHAAQVAAEAAAEAARREKEAAKEAAVAAAKKAKDKSAKASTKGKK